MFDLSDFYDYCAEHDVDVIPFDQLPAEAVTVRLRGCYSVGINFRCMETVREVRTAMMHECGHLHTGALAKVDSPFQLVEKNEYTADADSFQRYLPPEEIAAALRAGYVETWELAEYFDLDEAYIKKALHYWTECRGVDFNTAEGA